MNHTNSRDAFGAARPVRIGVLGAARIVRTALLRPAVAEVSGVHVEALAARDPERASAYAARYGVPRTRHSYDDLLSDPKIDAVYIALPAALHAQWTIAAIAAGKHVLTEKPFTSNAHDAERVAVASTASNAVVMEAYHSHYHPLQRRLRSIIDSRQLGRIRSARATFHVPIPPGRDIRWNASLGGGGLLDVGYYPVRQLTELFGDPLEIAARAKVQRGIDRLLTATMQFEGDIEGSISSSIWSARLVAMGLAIIGDRARLTVRTPFHPQIGGSIIIQGRRGRVVERVERRSTYAYQLDAFRDSVTMGTPVETGVWPALANLRVLDNIYAAAGLASRS